MRNYFLVSSSLTTLAVSQIVSAHASTASTAFHMVEHVMIPAIWLLAVASLFVLIIKKRS